MILARPKKPRREAPEHNAPSLWLALGLFLLVAGTLAVFWSIYTKGFAYSTIYTHDTIVFFDGIDRLDAGQVPHLDFSTPLGLLGYYIPYWGFQIVGGFPGAIEAGSVLLAAAILPIAALLLFTRVSGLMAALILLALAAMTVVPVNLGEDGNQVSGAMHYNRWGWALLVTFMIGGIRPL